MPNILKQPGMSSLSPHKHNLNTTFGLDELDISIREGVMTDEPQEGRSFKSAIM